MDVHLRCAPWTHKCVLRNEQDIDIASLGVTVTCKRSDKYSGELYFWVALLNQLQAIIYGTVIRGLHRLYLLKFVDSLFYVGDVSLKLRQEIFQVYGRQIRSWFAIRYVFANFV